MNTTRNRADFMNILFRGAPFEVGEAPTGFYASSTHKSGILLPRVEDVRLSGVNVAVTDTGGTGGGYAAVELMTLPATRIILIGSFLDLTVNSVAAGITLTAVVSFGLGTAATTNATIDSNEISMLSGAGSFVLSGGTNTGEATNPLLLTLFDAVTTTKVYLNIGVADAGISATSSMNVTAVARIIYFDASLGM